MAILTVDDLDIQFPFVPYDVQKELMNKVVQCIQNKENGLLESPTGTGKTLSLLCAAVAWQKKQKEVVKKAIISSTGVGIMSNLAKSKGQAHQSQTGFGSSNSIPGGVNPNVNPNMMDMFITPKIIYASRTHSQLSQAVQELKRSFYTNTKTVVLGSRDVMCIHEEVSRLQTSSSKIMACHLRVQARSCGYYNNVAQKKEEMTVIEKPILDIEDLVASGKKNRFCPFFMSREVVKDAEVVFMPYNYLLDPKLRSSHGIDLKNSIIILDEGHNIAKTCEESVSFEIKSSTIAKCMQEVTQTMNEFNEISQQIGTSTNANALLRDLSMGSLVTLKQSFLQLEQALDAYKVTQPTGVLIPGQDVLTTIFQNGFPPSTFPKVANELDAVASFQTYNNHDSSGCDTFSSILRVLSSQAMFRNPVIFADSYKVFLTEEKRETKMYTKVLEKSTSGNVPKVFNFWCFNPAVGLEMMMHYGPRCIILASGTLSPLPFLESELQIPFPVKLSNPHIISDNQLYACVLKNGPGPQCAKLSSSFQNRNNTDYLNGLGEVIRATCSIVPKGVLVFFPSYSVMDGCVKYWETHRVLEKISSHKKVFIEPKGKYEFSQVMQNYYDAVKSANGGCLMAVCRGKVSEGLDFSNDNGRAVIITGIPYSPYLDPHVTAKKAYLDSKMRNKGNINGRTWYQLEAVRALNQAVGRIIRHAQDYGAVLLCDERCDSADVLKNISPWLEKRLTKTSDFSQMLKGLSLFFKIPSRGTNTKTVPSHYSQTSSSTMGGFSVSSSSKLAPIPANLSYTEVSFVSARDIEMENADISQMYSDSTTKQSRPLADDLFGNLSSLMIKPAIDFNRTNTFTKPSSKFPETSIHSSPPTRQNISSGSSDINKIKPVKRKHIRLDPMMMDYKSSQQYKEKKPKLSIFSASYESESTDEPSMSMETDSTSATLQIFPSVKEFFDWVKSDLNSAQYFEFVSSVKTYRASKDIAGFSTKIRTLFSGSKLLQSLEGLKYVLPDSHFTWIKKKIESEK